MRKNANMKDLLVYRSNNILRTANELRKDLKKIQAMPEYAESKTKFNTLNRLLLAIASGTKEVNLLLKMSDITDIPD